MNSVSWVLQHRGAMTATIIAISVFLTATLGPFGTFDRGVFVLRLVYWAVAILVSVGIASFCIAVVKRIAPNLKRLWREMVLCSAMTALFTPFLYYWTDFLLSDGLSETPSMIWLAPNVFAICALVSALRHAVPFWAFHDFVEDTDSDTEPEQVFVPRLLERFDMDLRAPVQRLSVAGHKVQVVTTSGEQEIRMRFADAVHEMEGVPGFCSHRSHWVAESAIDIVRIGEKGRPELILKNGDVVPVSKNHEEKLAERGLVAIKPSCCEASAP